MRLPPPILIVSFALFACKSDDGGGTGTSGIGTDSASTTAGDGGETAADDAGTTGSGSGTGDDTSTTGAGTTGGPSWPEVSCTESTYVDEMSRRTCARMFSCNCDMPGGYASEDDCVADQMAVLAAGQTAASMGMLTFDADCCRRTIDRQGDPCVTAADYGDTQPSCMERCFLYHGATPAASMCEQEDQCEAGLVCAARVCAPFCDGIAGDGQDCSADSGRACDKGLWCDFSGDETCKPIPGENEPCGGGACQEGLYCDLDASTCIPALADGDDCNDERECLSQVCTDDKCAPAMPVVCG